ncbi:hypothetical protein LCGC14_0236270 [marine sediment metagenome]|uniref:Phage-like element PBSX protein XkdF domain-containing protein n=1 Tax=marine sediment metagenome TaxID=412755 RepID=A0A0F9UDQ9_9ZZZZ
MRLEDINQKNIVMVQDHELKNYMERANQIFKTARRWAQQIRRHMVGVGYDADGNLKKDQMTRDSLLETYYLLSQEAKKRNLTWKETDIDHKMTRTSLRGIDVGDFPPITVREAVVSLSGEFVTSPKKAKCVTVRLDADEFGDSDFPDDLEKRLVEMVMDQTGLPISVHRDADGLEGPIIPVFDLVLVPRGETADERDVESLRKRLGTSVSDDRVEDGEIDEETGDNGLGADTGVLEYISKYPSEHVAWQMAPGQFDEMRRENDKMGKGIHVIYGIKGGKSKIQSVRFNPSEFTVDEAKKWLAVHGFKTSVEAASGKVEKGSVPFLKSETERIVAGAVYFGYDEATDDELDSQGDWATPEAVYKAMKSWMIKTGGQMKFMHSGNAVLTPVVENVFTTSEMIKDDTVIPKNCWYLACYIPESESGLWKAITETQEITGFSMAGRATSESEEMDEE